MKKEKKKEELNIEALDIREDIKDNINDFKRFICNLKKQKRHNNNINFSIIIDNMSTKDIDTYLEYMTQILIDESIINKVVKYKDRFSNRSFGSKHAITIDLDKDYSNHYYRDADILMSLFIDSYKKDNILIFYSSSIIEDNNLFFKNEIIKSLPIYKITNEYNSDTEYSLLLEKYNEKNIKCDISKSSFKKLFDIVKYNNYAKSISISDYLYNYSIIKTIQNKKESVTINTFKELLNNEEKKEKKVTRKKEKDKKVDIDNLVGLSNIKDEIKKLLNYATFKKRINSKNTTYLNLFFLGNPGTGKTMIANIIASELYEMGYLEKDEIVKVVPNDLIGEYVGQTRAKAREILEKANGKLLFIDEAYLMYNPNYKAGNNPFMEEAIVELMKYLEDPKNIVIFAGYTKEMRNLYNVNPGLKSRIYKEIEFDDYTTDELYKILCDDLEKQGLNIDKKIKTKIIDYINSLKKDKNFGNARTMLKLSQTLIMNHANLDSETFIITKEDIPKYENKNIKRMGFDA